MRKQSILALVLVLTAYPGFAQKKNAPAAKPMTEQQLEQRAQEVLARLSLKQKIGQMAQITLDVIGKGSSVYASDEPFQLDSAKCRRALVEFGVGSVLNTPNNTARPREFWQATISRLQDYALKQAPAKVPLLYGIDAIHGPTYTAGATMFPQEVAMAATRNRALVRRGAEISAYETRASATPWTFAPVLDLGQDPRSPRHWETFGEDPYLVAELGREAILGYQGTGADIGNREHVAACAKHFLGYQVPVSGKDRTNAYISKDALYEYHLPPFRRAVEAGVQTFMINSALVNNYPVHANPDLLTGLLKKELGFKGLVVTDWGDIENLFTRDHIARDHKDAIRLGINAGIDMSMVPYHYEQFCTLLEELVREGAVSQARIDDAVLRILKVKLRAGLFETPVTQWKDYPKFGSPEFEKASYDAAAEAITLLKNEGDILPLGPGKKILLAGPNANSMRTLDGAWTYSWQGDKTELFAEKYRTIYEALQEAAGKENLIYKQGVRYKPGGKYYEEEAVDIADAVTAARQTDLIVLCLGENTYVEKPGDMSDLYLSDLQTQLAQALLATGKPVVLVLNEGRPRLISRIEPGLKAVVQAYLPGNFGGQALVDVLYGKVNPSGRLPYTYPRHPNALVGYIHKYSDEQKKSAGVYDYEADYNPQYEFGHGLSYTRFAFSGLQADKATYTEADTIRLSLTVANTGARPGKTAVEVYSADLHASLIAPDMRRLRAFTKMELAAGQQKAVAFKIPVADLRYAGPDGKPVYEPGTVNLLVEGQKLTIELK